MRGETTPLLPPPALASDAATRGPRDASDDARNKTPGMGPSLAPAARATNVVAVATFSWLGGLLKQGATAPLGAADLWPLEAGDETLRVAAALQRQTHGRGGGGGGGLWLPIRKAFGRNMYLAGVCKLAGDALGFVAPVCINAIIRFVQRPAEVHGAYDGYLLSAALFASSFLQTLCLHQHHHLVIREAIRARAALTMLVFDKSLALSAQTKSAVGSGKILNMATADTNRVLDLFYMIHYSWAAPLQLIVGMLLLVKYLGVASFAGVAVMVLLLPASAAFSSRGAKLSKRVLEFTDKRLKLLNELFQHIRVIKLYAWERHVLAQVDSVRANELTFLRSMIIWNALSQAALQAGPVLVALVSFAVFSWIQDTPLTPDKAFTAIALFGIFRLPLMTLPRIFSLIFQANVSVRRLEEFLALPDYKSDSLTPLSASTSLSSPSISRSDAPFELRSAVFRWSTGAKAATTMPPFARMSATIPRGQLTLVVGPIGSGKSTLLSTLVGELMPESGFVNIPSGKIAYAAQTPYLVAGTVQDNITFGAPLDQARLATVVRACELEADLALFPAGLASEIGENGVSLSGGQKQRISLARAVYRADMELYVFDDSLSALDARVATRIFSQCFSNASGSLLAGRTRVLSTHALQYTETAEWIVVMDQLKVAQMGSFHDLTKLTPDGKFAGMFAALEQSNTGHAEDADSATGSLAQSDSGSQPTPRRSSSFSGSSRGALIEDEAKVEGSLSWATYASYFASCGALLVVGAFSLLVCAQISSVSTDLWLTHWTSASPTEGMSLDFYLSVYAYLGLSTIVLAFIGDLASRYAGLRASKMIHHRLLYHVAKGTMRFFDSTPVGRILNRFSNDMTTIDQKLNTAIAQFTTMVLSLVSMLVIQSSTAPLLLALLIPVFGCYLSYQRYYAKSCRELQRLDNISKSPVYAHFTQTLNGLSTIRVFDVVDTTRRSQAARMDENTKAFLLLNLINRWLGVRLEFLGAVITFAVAFFVVFYHSVISSAMAGLLLSYSQSMTSLLNWIVRNNVDMENMMNGIERTDEYCTVSTEPLALESSEHRQSSGSRRRLTLLALRPQWPERGQINFINVYVTYHPASRPVLHGVSFAVQGGEKVGICGRTGAGKSSLLAALFRLVPCSGGLIEIDSVPITQLDLTELRSRMAIIPQDPVLFAASLRFNLDPTGRATDGELWAAIRKANLSPVVSSLSGGLDAEVLEAGENLSVGERQLICLARAILRQSTILCLDEATASMDYATDELIQATIRREFAASTVLTIAHRVSTIIDYDTVVVLDNGRLLEIGPPAELRVRPGGEFAAMLQQS